MNYKEIRNYGKTIKTYFQFLSRQGFSVKQYDNGIDYEVIYSRPECEISIFCELGVDAKMFALYKNRLMEDKQLIENSYLDTFIDISKEGGRYNLLNCDLFDPLSMRNLKENVINSKNDINNILRIYSEFLKKNLYKLL